ncbi:MAG: ATP-binding protein, partial [Alphaproteobacteria bacterium]|nr:ATP-binding protein [Alphaproteobacteria bacterium]
DILIQVWDTGPGIESDTLAHIFNEFNAHNTIPHKTSSGINLGLYIVWNLSILLGLEVAVSTRHGRGSVFTIKIPCE